VKLPVIKQANIRLVVRRDKPPHTNAVPGLSTSSLEIPPPPVTGRKIRPRDGDTSSLSVIASKDLKEESSTRKGEGETSTTSTPLPIKPGETLDMARTEGSKSSSAGIITLPVRFETATLNSQGRLVQRHPLFAKVFHEELASGIRLEMVEIPTGRFLMGAPPGQKGAYPNEKPQHEVTVSGFYMSRQEITQAQWRAIAGLPKVFVELNPAPSRFTGDSLPVEQVSWLEALEFCLRLQHLTGKAYLLPTEAEWEYACRAGAQTPYSFGETLTVDIANYDGKSTTDLARKGMYRQKTVPVGSLAFANAFGLFDMHGNVSEWCLDEWHDTYDGAPNDSRMWGTLDGSYGVVRGGSWFDSGAKSVSYHRDRYLKQAKSHSVGFRVSLKLGQ